MNAQRLKTTKGVKKDSETLLIEFGREIVPNKVFLSYPVRYVPKPFKHFNCKRFGHAAKN